MVKRARSGSACRKRCRSPGSTTSSWPRNLTAAPHHGRIPAGEIGQAAADCLVTAITGSPVPTAAAFPYRMIIRGSTGPVRRRKAKRLS
ncbi:MAG: hypothetical protein WDN49_17690 [Acetobacteraceae bacterium]